MILVKLVPRVSKQFKCSGQGPVSRKSRNFSGDIILFVSSKRRRLEARNFAVIFIFIPFTTYEKNQLYRIRWSKF